MTKKRKIYVTVSWIFVISCMGFIFWMSGFNATDSSDMSDSVIKKILSLFGEEFSSFVIRKAAHIFEFFILSISLFNAIYATRKSKYTPFSAFALSVFYAATDEFHQLFVEGRACQLRDIFIDAGGALIGVVASLIILKIIHIIKESRVKNGNTQTV